LLKVGFGDTSRMYVAGGKPSQNERLIQVTHADAFIDVAKPGNTFANIGHAIQSFVEAERMSSCVTCNTGQLVFHAHQCKPLRACGTGPVFKEGKDLYD
jgi:methionyl aminopeptidase